VFIISKIYSLEFNGISYHHSYDAHPNSKDFTFHCHNFFEIYYFIKGNGTFIIEGTHYKLKEKTLLIVRNSEFHHYKIDIPSEYERCALHFKVEDLSPILSNKILIEPFMSRPLGKFNIIENYSNIDFQNIYSRIDKCSLLPIEEQKLMMQFLLGELLTSITCVFRKNTSLLHQETHKSLVTDLIQYINLNISTKFSLENLASNFYVSKYYISHIFKEHTGVSIVEYVLRKKVALANQLISQGKKAYEVCDQCGFGDYSSFYRAYKRILGISPSNRVAK